MVRNYTIEENIINIFPAQENVALSTFETYHSFEAHQEQFTLLYNFGQ